MGKILITTSMQQIDSSLMVVLQQAIIPRVVVEQETNFCPQVISAQRTNYDLMVVLQRIVMPRVVANGWAHLTSQATSAQ